MNRRAFLALPGVAWVARKFGRWRRDRVMIARLHSPEFYGVGIGSMLDVSTATPSDAWRKALANAPRVSSNASLMAAIWGTAISRDGGSTWEAPPWVDA